MSSVVSEGIILVAVVVAASLLSATFMTGIDDIQSSTVTTTKAIGDTIRTAVKVIHAVNSSETVVKIWIKNVGSMPIHTAQIEVSDLYFGEAGNFSHHDYASTGVGWDYTILDPTSNKWSPQDTLEITLTLESALSTGDYYVSFSTHNGVKDDDFFSIG